MGCWSISQLCSTTNKFNFVTLLWMHLLVVTNFPKLGSSGVFCAGFIGYSYLARLDWGVWLWVALGWCLWCVQVYLAITASCRSGICIGLLVLALGYLVFFSLLQRHCLLLGVVSCTKGVISLVDFFLAYMFLL